MLLMHRVSATPVLFADVRHYSPTATSGTSRLGPARHLVRRPQRRPGAEPGPGPPLPRRVLLPRRRASVAPPGRPRRHDPGPAVTARRPLPHAGYPGAFERFDAATNEALMRQSTYVWPHAFTRLAASAQSFLSRFRGQPHPRRAGRHNRPTGGHLPVLGHRPRPPG